MFATIDKETKYSRHNYSLTFQYIIFSLKDLITEQQIKTLANVHGLFSSRNNDESDEDDSNNRFVGGISDRGGGRCVHSIVVVQYLVGVGATLFLLVLLKKRRSPMMIARLN